MKKNLIKLISVVLIFFLALSFTACTQDNVSNEEDNIDMSNTSENIGDVEEVAQNFVKDLVDKKYQKAYDNYSFSEKMKDAAPPSVLMNAMEQLTGSVGEFIKIADTSKTAHAELVIVSVTCEFEKDYMNINVVFDKDKNIAGFNFSKAEDFNKSSEDSKDGINNSFVEKEVTVGSGKWQLPGTLTLPKGEGPFPAVVLVHGSGPSDRDETIGPNKPFRDIAWGLAEKGVAVLRYEKRTKEYQQKLINVIRDFTVNEETIDDALLAVELLKNYDQIDHNKIYVLGHSLGGYLIPRIGIRDEEIAGFIVMAGPTRHLEDLIVEQYEYLANLDNNVTDGEKEQIQTVKEARDRIKNEAFLVNDPDPKLLMGVNAKYWLDLMDYKPTELAKKLNRPILILQGERDYQSTMEDFQNWKKSLGDKDNVIFKSYNDLNHLLMYGEGAPNPQEYGIEGKVEQEVIDDISLFINGQK